MSLPCRIHHGENISGALSWMKSALPRGPAESAPRRSRSALRATPPARSPHRAGSGSMHRGSATMALASTSTWSRIICWRCSKHGHHFGVGRRASRSLPGAPARCGHCCESGGREWYCRWAGREFHRDPSVCRAWRPPSAPVSQILPGWLPSACAWEWAGPGCWH